jgi:hypothetical protein
VDIASLEEEAENCRRKALVYLGRPEASFLISVARQFERLAAERRSGRGNGPHAEQGFARAWLLRT